MGGGVLSGDGGGLLCIGCHKLLQGSLLIVNCVGHIFHIVIHFVEEVGIEASG